MERLGGFLYFRKGNEMRRKEKKGWGLYREIREGERVS